MRLIAPGDKRKQVASGVDTYDETRGYKRREAVIREEKMSYDKGL